MATLSFSESLTYVDGVNTEDVLPQDVKTTILTTPTKLVEGYQIADTNGGNFSVAPGFTADFGVFVKNLSLTTAITVTFRFPSMAQNSVVTLQPGDPPLRLPRVQNVIGCFIATAAGTAKYFGAYWGT